MISRALVEIFSRPELAQALAFRGGTALYKLHLHPPARYSEDIDLVQVKPGPIGRITAALREALDPWLGRPAGTTKDASVTLQYRFESESLPRVPLRLKVEINTREHFNIFGLAPFEFGVSSRWFNGRAQITTYSIDELLGTKLRALYQRKKGRDLFDLAFALQRSACDPQRVVEAFARYMEQDGQRITRALFEKNLATKVSDPRFTSDIVPLLAAGVEFVGADAAQLVTAQLLVRLPGRPWRGAAN